MENTTYLNIENIKYFIYDNLKFLLNANIINFNIEFLQKIHEEYIKNHLNYLEKYHIKFIDTTNDKNDLDVDELKDIQKIFKTLIFQIFYRKMEFIKYIINIKKNHIPINKNNMKEHIKKLNISFEEKETEIIQVIENILKKEDKKSDFNIFLQKVSEIIKKNKFIFCLNNNIIILTEIKNKFIEYNGESSEIFKLYKLKTERYKKLLEIANLKDTNTEKTRKITEIKEIYEKICVLEEDPKIKFYYRLISVNDKKLLEVLYNK